MLVGAVVIMGVVVCDQGIDPSLAGAAVHEIPGVGTGGLPRIRNRIVDFGGPDPGKAPGLFRSVERPGGMGQHGQPAPAVNFIQDGLGGIFLLYLGRVPAAQGQKMEDPAGAVAAPDIVLRAGEDAQAAGYTALTIFPVIRDGDHIVTGLSVNVRRFPGGFVSVGFGGVEMEIDL